MTEDVIQYIWNTQSFDKANLRTTEGIPIEVIRQGIQNTDSGPDFSSARVIIDGVEWVGDVEIHIKTSMWKTHNHNLDLSLARICNIAAKYLTVKKEAK